MTLDGGRRRCSTFCLLYIRFRDVLEIVLKDANRSHHSYDQISRHYSTSLPKGLGASPLITLGLVLRQWITESLSLHSPCKSPLRFVDILMHYSCGWSGLTPNIECPACLRAFSCKLNKSDDSAGIFRLHRNFSIPGQCLCELSVECGISCRLHGGEGFAGRGISIHCRQGTCALESAIVTVGGALAIYHVCPQARPRTQRHQVSSLSSVGPPGSRDETIRACMRLGVSCSRCRRRD